MAAAVPIVFQVAAAAAISAAGVASGGWMAALIIGGATLLGGYVANELFGNSDDLSQDSDKMAIRGNYVSAEKAIPLIYGERLVGSNDVFIEVGQRGFDPVDDGKRYLWIVHVLGEGVCNGLSQTIVEEVPYDTIYVAGKPIWEYDTDTIDYWFYDGTDTQTYNTILNAGTRRGQEDKYTDALRNTAYIVFRLKFSDSTFTGVPSREVVLEGLKVKDVRDEVVKWSKNPALILYDYLTNKRYGLGWDEASIYEPSFEEAATYCDNYGWEINYVIASSIKSQTIIDTLLGHFRGALYWYDDKLYVRYLDLREETPVFHIKDEHIARTPSGEAMITVSQPSRFNTPDGAVVNYIDSRDNWVTDRVNIGEVDGQINKLDFPGFTDRNLALEMGTYVLERQRLNRVYNFTLRPDTVALDTNDLIEISSKELALSDALARVKTNSIAQNGLIQITAVLEDITLYDKVFDPDTSEIYTVDFPSIADEPPPVENVYVEEDVYSYRDVSYIRLNIFFTPPQNYPWFSNVDVYVGYPVGDVPPLESEFLYRFPASGNFQIDPVEEGEVYYIRLNSVSTYGVKQQDHNAYKIVHKVGGVSSVYPDCPANLAVVVNVTSVDLIADLVPSPDISGYELRLGPSWTGGIFITFRSHPVYSFNSVKPGSHTFWVNTQHRNGNYCTSPPGASATMVEPPPGSHLFFEQVVDYSTGTATNMTVTGTYPNQSMECSHTGDVLIGEYTSLEIDTGNITADLKMLIYVLFDFQLNTVTPTWNVVAPIPMTWTEMAYDPIEMEWNTWLEFLGDPYKSSAPRLNVSVEYSETPGGPYNTVDRLELLTAIVYGRYIKVKYHLEDYNLASNIIVGPSAFKAAYIEETLLIEA